MSAEQKLMEVIAEHVDTTSLAYPAVLNAASSYARETAVRTLRVVADETGKFTDVELVLRIIRWTADQIEAL